jgi:poly(ADP-ribose) glycohydrolase ARH3
MAVSLGGDTDTIASMAAAIAGAHSGVERIPDSLLKHCEARDRMQKYAEALCEIVAGDGSNGTNGQKK